MKIIVNSLTEIRHSLEVIVKMIYFDTISLLTVLVIELMIKLGSNLNVFILFKINALFKRI
jgi:hypothetical protein